MRRMCVALALGSLIVAGWAATPALAQDTKTARGTVTAMAADSVTVKAGTQEMKFGVDAKTTIEAQGAGTAARQAQAAGQAGPKLSEVVKVGQAVEVRYHETGGTLHAARIRAIPSAGSGGGTPDTDATATKTATGTVRSVSATSMTISGSSGAGATFSQTFVIDSSTKVVGRGAGTAAAAAGGKVVVTDLVGNGDGVSVSYKTSGSALHASEIRVTSKAAK
jgi:hypothetical protein